MHNFIDLGIAAILFGTDYYTGILLTLNFLQEENGGLPRSLSGFATEDCAGKE